MQTKINRRQFIKTTALASAAVGPYLAPAGQAAASERVRLGFIGCGGRARQLMPMFQSHPAVEVPAELARRERRLAALRRARQVLERRAREMAAAQKAAGPRAPAGGPQSPE